MNSLMRHPLHAFWGMSAKPLQTAMLEQAVERELFTVLEHSMSAQELAQRLGLHLPTTQVWLDMLWSMGLLERQQEHGENGVFLYVSAPLAQAYFSPRSGTDCSLSYLYRSRFLQQLAGQFPHYLVSGQADPGVMANASEGSWAQAAKDQIAQEQIALTVPSVMALLDTLPSLPEQGHFLDLGGGPGHVAIALAQRWPNWSGAIYEEPETAKVAAEHIAQAGLSARVQAHGADLNQGQIGQAYDFIWCSSVLHFLTQPLHLLQSMFAALKPGGVVLLAHAERQPQALTEALVLPFYSALLLRGKYVPAPGQIGDLLKAAGFESIRDLGPLDFPLAPVQVHWGQRA